MSTTIELVRDALRAPIAAATSAHPGLLIQRGLTTAESDRADGTDDRSDASPAVSAKQAHIARICTIPADPPPTSDRPFYANAYQRWLHFTRDPARFRSIVMKVDGRLLIGLSGGAALETACAVSHTYGTPYIPGSSIKGVARAYASRALPGAGAIIDDLFGAAPSEDDPEGLAGLITFHDAWWVPGSAPGNRPFVQDIVTSHHSAYYASDGATPATDLDSPIPNALIAVHGSFLIVLEGAAEYMDLAIAIVEQACSRDGVGAKTRAGYGYLVPDTKAQSALDGARADERERDARAQQEAARKAALQKKLEAMSPLQREVEEFLLNRPNQQEAEIPTLINSLLQGVWPADKKPQVAALLQERMLAAGKWRPHSHAKRPERDYPHQDTLQVLRWLEGKD